LRTRNYLKSRGENVTGRWRKMKNEKLRNLQPLLPIKQYESNKMNTHHCDNLKSQIKGDKKRGGHVRINGDMKSAYIWSKTLKGKEHYEDLGLDGRTPKQIE
jgi:hypothetical protein